MDDNLGFDAAAAKEYILGKFIEQGDFGIFKESVLEKMVEEVIASDQRYISSLPEDAYYDDDAAFEFLIGEMQAAFPEQKMYMMRFVEDYMDYNEEYLERNGLIDWD